MHHDKNKYEWEKKNFYNCVMHMLISKPEITLHTSVNKLSYQCTRNEI